jgi:hypothetical protein
MTSVANLFLGTVLKDEKLEKRKLEGIQYFFGNRGAYFRRMLGHYPAEGFGR